MCQPCSLALRQATRRPFNAQSDPRYLGSQSEEPGASALLADCWAVFASGSYEKELRSALLAFKDHGRLALRRPLSTGLDRSIHRAVAHVRASDVPLEGGAHHAVALIPIPTSAKGYSARGYNPLQLLLRKHLAATLSLRMVDDCFTVNLLAVRRRFLSKKHSQKSQSASARRANVRGGFKVRRRALKWLLEVHGEDVLIVLVDDVVTTGATLEEARNTLMTVGLRCEGAAVLAAVAAHRSSASAQESG